jgi:predicted RND superfamily exporter protein
MWNQIVAFILKYRLLFIIATVVLTVFMFFEGRKAELTYDYVAIVPNYDK